MHLGETLLVLGALVIFSIATLYLNNSRLDNNTKLMEVELETTAIGLAQSFIEEAQSLQFDEVLTDPDFSGDLPDDFTDVSSLGLEGETYPNFDDVDDFNGYSANINTPRADYNVSIVVSYVDSANLNPDYSNKSFLKFMSVNVSSVFFSDSIKLDYLHSYY